MADEAGVSGVLGGGRLADNHLGGRDAAVDDLLDGSLGEVASSSGEEFSIGIVLSAALVVELHIVPVDQVAHCLMHGHVGSVGVMFLLEVGSLGCMRDEVVGQLRPKDLLEGD